MSAEEARAWLRGERSWANYIRGNAPSVAEAEAWLMVADAAKMQEAYWILRAHREGLLDDAEVSP